MLHFLRNTSLEKIHDLTVIKLKPSILKKGAISFAFSPYSLQKLFIMLKEQTP